MSNTVTSAFIDLATFDEIEKYLYNGPTAVTYFVRCVRKSTWGAQVPVTLTQNAGNPDFDSDVAFQISRAGDYLLNLWLRFTTPKVEVVDDGTVRWVNNLAHNLIDLTWVSFNDLKVQEFDSYWLDIWSAHTVPASKRTGYSNMVGNELQILGQQGGVKVLEPYTFNLPLPFFFTRDTGIALPTAALPYNEMRIHFEFRKWQELLILEGGANLVSDNLHLKNVQLWANYAVVSNEERVKMGKCPRDMVIEQVQGVRRKNDFLPKNLGVDNHASYDIRFSHSIKAVFWVVGNTTKCGNAGGCSNQAHELSNYTTRSGCCGGGANPATKDGDVVGDVNGFLLGEDPVHLSSLLYENTYRLFQMGSDYFSLVQPWYHWTSIPEVTGYHSYSFALKPESLDPSFSTNFGKLTNVSLELTPSQDAVWAAQGLNADGTEPSPDKKCPQNYALFIRGLNFNIVRISG